MFKSNDDSGVDLGALSLPFVEELLQQYQRDPASVPEDWRKYFAKAVDLNGAQVQLGPSFSPTSHYDPPSKTRPGPSKYPSDAMSADVALQDKVVQLLRSFRVRGHLIAKLDPLELPRPEHPELNPEYYGISEGDLDKTFVSQSVHTEGPISVRELINSVRKTYCGYIGVQYMHIDHLEAKLWLERKMEKDHNQARLTHADQVRILTKLTDASTLEEFIQKKFRGAKSFSLEGAESLIPLMSTAIDAEVMAGADEVIIAMAHRGRLNVLANILGKDAGQIFHEFDDATPERLIGRGDVKYHLGFSNEWQAPSGSQCHMTLCFNPSHLEFVNTVALGRTRAKQDRAGDYERRNKFTILIHGDAAFAGEGIVQETLNLSELEGYRTGGTLHIVVNNQIGFTTSPKQSRSSTYATDIAKMLQIPIFHVNGENPEAVAQVVQVAVAFRRKFQKDVVIDMYGYRRHGHNEGDEPAFTQPVMYAAIRKRKSVREGYLEHLMALGQIDEKEAHSILQERTALLEAELDRVRSADYVLGRSSTLQGVWNGYVGGPEKNVEDVDTGVELATLERLMRQCASVPDDIPIHPKVKRLLGLRQQMAAGEKPLDWGAAELLAMATIAYFGNRVRFTGQDVERGTFSHRHAVFHNVTTEERYHPLRHLSDDQGFVEIVNSPLSEAGVLGFEYGYSLDAPDALVMWEAQFGDFANTAQCIFDQFIMSAEDKWRRNSGVVVLLPHGAEGMGPEHSSARVERYLSACAEDNIQVAMPTTPKQMFHLLRRQVVRRWRKPLIVFTPKSLLRHREAVNTISEFTEGRFERVIGDERSVEESTKTTRVLLCSGKLYYELKQERAKRERYDVAIIRLEQFYPFPEQALKEAVESCLPASKGGGMSAVQMYWVQDEPINMGAWAFMRLRLGERAFDRFMFSCFTRPESASPATGSKASHGLEQGLLMDLAFHRQDTDTFS